MSRERYLPAFKDEAARQKLERRFSVTKNSERLRFHACGHAGGLGQACRTKLTEYSSYGFPETLEQLGEAKFLVADDIDIAALFFCNWIGAGRQNLSCLSVHLEPQGGRS